ncbi:YraN family protein [uncultured Bifidobacterium sp.]|uniref:YraN family protein n=1 Tax=uncultured Bifidobacterium sp. TaxID=165187 RepID=UPI0026279F1D|nr:YraN family protein [uncultured Bifidobacterium sp.]
MPLPNHGDSTNRPSSLPISPSPSSSPLLPDNGPGPASAMSDPHLNRHDLGVLGEAFACELLTRHGWRVLDRNWRSRFGELDIIAMDSCDYLVFVEVKTRRCHRFGTPAEAVTVRKRRNLRLAASQWLANGNARGIRHRGTRFDVVSIVVRGGAPHATHLAGAF